MLLLFSIFDLSLSPWIRIPNSDSDSKRSLNPDPKHCLNPDSQFGPIPDLNQSGSDPLGYLSSP